MAHEWTEQQPELPRPRWYWLSQRLIGGGPQVPAAFTAAAVTLFTSLAVVAGSLTAAAALPALPTWLHAQWQGAAFEPPPGDSRLLIAVGIVTTLACAAAAGGALARGLYTAHGLRDRRGLMGRAAAGLTGFVALCLGGTGSWLAASGQAGLPLQRLLGIQERPWLGWALTLAMVVASTWLLYGVVLRARPAGRSLAWGAGLTVVAWLGSHALSVAVFGELSALASPAFPVLALGLVLSQYVGAFAILLGAEVDACIAGDARREACGVVRPLDAPSRTFS